MNVSLRALTIASLLWVPVACAASEDASVTVAPAKAAPVIDSVMPGNAQVASVVVVTGSNFSDISRIAFNGVDARFMVISDVLLHATVPAAAASGTLAITNQAGTGSTSFTVVPSPAVLVGAGDISTCLTGEQEETALLLDNIPGTVFTAGDNANSDGTPQEFANCYDPAWGRHKSRTRPTPGNVDYDTPNAAGYFDYFGPNAVQINDGYYSYDLGDWHVIALNSECHEIGGCEVDSPQGQWLRADLLRNDTACTVVYQHHPRFSSGRADGDNDVVQGLWQILYDAGVELLIAGHEHNYERLAPLDADGNPDPVRGLREIIVGNGGGANSPFDVIQPHSVIRNDTDSGVLKLTLNSNSYDWEHIPIAGRTFTDAGTGDCFSVNQVPFLDAGEDIVASGIGDARLKGVALDDARGPSGTMVPGWSQLDGPATVVFADSSSPESMATFPAPGFYRLELAGTDGEFAVSDTVTVSVIDPGSE
ncbi:MAG: metallophosphoesterase family protein [Gammaproteobacteria bacterium]